LTDVNYPFKPRTKLAARAVHQALARASWSVADIDRIEINEAFAAVALACLRELGLAEDMVNVEGGAVAHGHPIGASGAVLATRLMHSMHRDGLRRGIVTLCIGGGQGIALALESITNNRRLVRR
jgi:acetyl-CoA C-acetyltransferase